MNHLPPSGSHPTPLSKPATSVLPISSSTSLLPVTLTHNNEGLLAHVAGRSEPIKLEAASNSTLSSVHLTNAHAFLLSVVQPHALASVSTPAQLLSLGPPVFVAVPSTLLSFIKRYPTMANSVLKLATKPHGYRLPNAIITAEQLRFNNGLCFAFSAPAGLIKGAFSVAIKAQEQQLLLELSPILTTVEITAKCHHTDTAPLAHSISTSPEITAPKTSVSSYYRQFLTQLEQAPKAMEPRSNLTSTTGEHKVAADFLSLALAKAGALPQCSDKHNLTNALLKRTLLHVLPKLLPETLISLSNPQQLQHALLSFARLNIQPTHWHAPSPDHANTLLFLCQWLLGKKRRIQ